MSKTKLLGRDAILDAEDAETRDVPVPEWKGKVRVRTITAAERDAFDEKTLRARLDKKPGRVRARLVALCAVAADGGPLFTEADVEALAAKSGKALVRVYDAADRLNYTTSADIEELEGN